ncbi:MAG: hypothetical protein L3J41_01520 [Melioribacteraceae bacterium]|nr:hypothetical protein [Melioribacteraceae bacterium]
MLNKINRLSLLLFFVSILVIAQNNSIKVGNVFPGEIDLGGFNLSEDSIIEINGVGTSLDEWNEYLKYYAWILETDSRKVIWSSEKCDDYSDENGDYDIEEKLKLKSGNYEVYFSAGAKANKYFTFNLGAIQGLIGGRKSDIKKYRDEYFINVSGKNGIFEKRKPFQLVNDLNKDAIVTIIRVGDSEKIEKRFSVEDDTDVKIYGIGEGVKKQFYDFGFIYNVSHNKKVWMFNRDDASQAGGGKKNIVQKAVVTLKKGSYYVVFKSDDSHSFDEWNVLPPNDPQHWGIVVSLVDENDRKNIAPFNENDIVEPVLEMIRVEEDEHLSKGLSLSKSMKIRILSIGEGYKSLADYGWIINADTKEIVWKMNHRDTEYAGGARKNRMVDETIRLDAGNYIVNYVTDDSHNYDDWNAAPPFDEERWGITIWTINKKDRKNVKTFNSKNYKSKNLITKITKVGDDEKLVKRFKLFAESDVRIIAFGERDGNDLADYAWITDEDGNTVWEMKYRETSHAGGAKKNRLFNEVVKLKAGKYKLHYKTDDSHSYEEWNSTPPDNPQMYGVTLLYEK